jgi:hypothetical protein
MHVLIWIRQARAARLTCWPLLLLMLAAGCTRGHDHEHVDVSGKVLYKGKPLPGGTVKFVTTTGGYVAFAPIDEDGNYQIKAPIGEVKIGLENRLLQLSPSRRGVVGHHRPPEGELGPDATKGRFVPLPAKYYSPETSELKYNVENKPQTHDIVLE